MRDVEWVRTQWHEAKWVAQGLGSTAVAGHSFGALLAARIAAAHPEIAAFVSLGGGLHQFVDSAAELLNSIRAPNFFIFSSSVAPSFERFLDFERIDNHPDPQRNLWPNLAQNKHAATYNGGHFEYLDPDMSGNAPCSGCSLIGDVAAALAALFIASNVQSLTQIPVDLHKPTPHLSDAQQALASQHLTSIDRIESANGCRVDLKWKVGDEAGARALGPLGNSVAGRVSSPCHYPNFFNLKAMRAPSTKLFNFTIPQDRVCQPGMPSPLRFRRPPNRPTARATSPTVLIGRLRSPRKTASSSSFKPACSAGASGDSRTRSRKSSRRSATMLLIAIGANRLSAVSNCNSSAFVPVLRAL
jgi:hypothetical protein